MFTDNQFQQEKQIILDHLNRFRNRTTHPLSASLPINPFLDYRGENYSTVSEYNSPASKPSMYDYTVSPNIGWKLHLNVAPQDVPQVSYHLLKNGYDHKYLSGGNIDDGKIFTLYIGSYLKVSAQSVELSNSLLPFLCRPKAFGEIEFAPGIIGRFRARQNVNDTDHSFNSYGTCGFSLLEEPMRVLHQLRQQSRRDPNNSEKQRILEEYQKKAEEESFFELLRVYGDYFYPL